MRIKLIALSIFGKCILYCIVKYAVYLKDNHILKMREVSTKILDSLLSNSKGIQMKLLLESSHTQYKQRNKD